MMRMPDGHGRIELSRFLAPPVVADHRNAPVNALGYLRVMFAVDDLYYTPRPAPQTRRANSSTKWSSTKTSIGSATSEAPRAFSSGWPNKSADHPRVTLEPWTSRSYPFCTSRMRLGPLRGTTASGSARNGSISSSRGFRGSSGSAGTRPALISPSTKVTLAPTRSSICTSTTSTQSRPNSTSRSTKKVSRAVSARSKTRTATGYAWRHRARRRAADHAGCRPGVEEAATLQ